MADAPFSQPSLSSDSEVLAGQAARRVLLGILAWALVAAATMFGSGPPALIGADAGPEVASGERALEMLERLARGDGENGVERGALTPPRPIGSRANERCAERILDELRRIGFRPEVQEEFGVHPRQRCAGTVRNIVARLRGGRGGVGTPGAILCMAHYDSVGAGPGVGDDLAGVAAWIEVARALRERGLLNRDVIFLFEDGEEHGLLGAEVFAAKHPWAKDVGAVVNLEGRGTEGPSRMFETGPGNDWIVRAFRSEARAPSATSLSSEIYRRMPNDTDYTVWRERGVPGLNFAFIGGVTRYHTPLDSLANLSPRSLQHHVTNGMDAILALDGAVFPGEAGASADAGRSDAVFFDVAGGSLLLMKTRTARILGIALLVAALWGVVRSIRVGAARPLRIALSMGLIVVTLAVGAYAAGVPDLLRGVLGAEAVARQPAHLAIAAIGLMAAGIVGWALASFVVARLASGAEMGAAVLLTFAGLNGALTLLAPGASFVTAVPTVIFAMCSLVLRLRSDVDARWCRSALVALAAAAVVLTPLHEGLITAFGVGNPAAVVAPLLVGALLLLPSLMGPGRVAALWIGGIALVVAALAPVFLSQLDRQTALEPGHLNLVHVTDEDRASWLLNSWRTPPPQDLASDLLSKLPRREAAADETPTPMAAPRKGIPGIWTGTQIGRSTAAAVVEDPPRAEVVEATDGALAFRAIPGRDCDQLSLSVSGSSSLVIDGVTVPGPYLRLLNPPVEGVLVRLNLLPHNDRGVDVRLVSQRFGLRGVRGRMADEYLGARPPEYVPFGHGDGSAMLATVTLVEKTETAGEKAGEEGEE